MTIQELNKELGNIDIYLLDQILKGRFSKNIKLLDAGCGEGRNVIYFLNNKFEVFGLDQNHSAIKMLRYISRTLHPTLPKENFITGSIDRSPFPADEFNAIICSAVLHFAEDEEHFYSMWEELFRILQPGGILFIRMASNIGAEDFIQVQKGQKTIIPDGSLRFLLTRKHLNHLEKNLKFTYLEPVKTVNVQDQRFMTTLVLKKD